MKSFVSWQNVGAPLVPASRGARSQNQMLVSGMVVSFGVTLQLVGIEVDVAQTAGAVPLRLVVEVTRLRMSAFPSYCHRPGAHFVSKFHHRNKAVSAGSVPLPRSWIRPGPERCQRAPGGRGKPHRRAWLGIVEVGLNIPGQALKPIDISPRRLPGAEVRGQLGGGGGQGLQRLITRAARSGENSSSYPAIWPALVISWPQ